MKYVFIVVFFGLMTLPSYSLHAQNDFAVLEKNVNLRAKQLSHKLNASKDTLVLRSAKLISSVYAVNMDYQREVDLTVKSRFVKIPITNLSKGKHVFVVVQSAMRIVFVVKVLRDDELLLASADNGIVQLKKD